MKLLFEGWRKFLNEEESESEKIKAKIQEINELEELKLYFGTMPVTYQNNDKIIELFKAKKAEIKMQAN